jgi:hypothetical protein
VSLIEKQEKIVFWTFEKAMLLEVGLSIHVFLLSKFEDKLMPDAQIMAASITLGDIFERFID